MREAAKREFAPVVVFVGPALPAVSHIGGPSLFVVSNDLKFGHPATATISARYLWALSKNSKRMRHDLSILGTGLLGHSYFGHFPKKANECDTTCPFWAPPSGPLIFWALSKKGKRMRHHLSILGTGGSGPLRFGHRLLDHKYVPPLATSDNKDGPNTRIRFYSIASNRIRCSHALLVVFYIFCMTESFCF